MNKKHLLTLGILAAATTVAVMPASAFAFEGKGYGDGEMRGGRMGMMREEGGNRRMGHENGLISEELREQFREDHQNLSEEEKAQLREQHHEMRQAHQSEMEEFTGVTREETWEAHENGQTMGDILSAAGKTEAEAEEFLTQQAEQKVADIVQRHDLDESQADSLIERIGDHVQRILKQWFGN